jgi:hypothetical protein
MDQLRIDDYWVEEAELRDRRPLRWENSGNSRMYHCTWRGEEFVLKRYAEMFRESADQHALGGQIRWREELSDSRRAHLDRIAAWPRHRVRDRGILQGVLLPYAGREFFQPRTDRLPRRPRRLDHLIRYYAEGEPRPGVAPHMKKHALGHAVEVLVWLHERQVVANDVRESNILTARDGNAVYFVDCDAMIGPWGAVSSPAAPPMLAELVRDAGRPTPATDLSRLAWVAVWVLLDMFSLTSVPVDRLTPLITAQDAGLIERAAYGRPVPRHDWMQLADRWTRPIPVPSGFGTWRATAPIARNGERSAPAPTRPMTEPVPVTVLPQGSWVPEMFRQPWVRPAPQTVRYPAVAGPQSAPEPNTDGADPRKWLLIASVGVLAMLVLAALSLALGV